MKLCVPFKYFEAALMCAAKNDVRHYLNGVHFNQNKIESTCGHVAYQVKLNLDFQPKDTYFDEYMGEWPNVIIGQFSHNPTKSQVNKVQYIFIDISDDGDVNLDYKDVLFNTRFTQKAKLISWEYPNIDDLVSKHKIKKNIKDQFNIGFNAEYLALPSKLLHREKFFASCIMKSNSPDNCATFELKRAASEAESEMLLVMPIRL